MEISAKDQALTDEELAAFEKEIERLELLRRIENKNIEIKQQNGYFEAVSLHAAIDKWRRDNADGYAASRRKKAEEKAAKEGRILRSYGPSTPERVREQKRTSKQKQREDADFAKAEKDTNTAARQMARASMTDDERAEANRIRRLKFAEKKARKLAEAQAEIAKRSIF